MRQPIRLVTPAEALQRVFLPSLTDASIRTYTTRPILKRTLVPQQCIFRPPSTLYRQHTRLASSTSSPTVRFRPFAPPAPTRTPAPTLARFGPKETDSDRRPRDEEISAYKVQVVLPDTSLSEPCFLSEILSTRALDEKGRFTQFLLEVSPPSAERPYPVCKMYDKKAVREAEEARRKTLRANKKTSGQAKELDLSWTVSDNDLGHRMARMREFLEKGWKVKVVFGSQRKSGWAKKREASDEEARGVLEKIRTVVGEVEGAQEREMQGTVGKEAVLLFDGKAKKDKESN